MTGEGLKISLSVIGAGKMKNASHVLKVSLLNDERERGERERESKKNGGWVAERSEKLIFKCLFKTKQKQSHLNETI